MRKYLVLRTKLCLEVIYENITSVPPIKVTGWRLESPQMALKSYFMFQFPSICIFVKCFITSEPTYFYGNFTALKELIDMKIKTIHLGVISCHSAYKRPSVAVGLIRLKITNIFLCLEFKLLVIFLFSPHCMGLHSTICHGWRQLWPLAVSIYLVNLSECYFTLYKLFLLKILSSIIAVKRKTWNRHRNIHE